MNAPATELLWVARRALVTAASTMDGPASPLLARLDGLSRCGPRPSPGPLARAAERFRLSEQETFALAVVAAVEIDPAIGALIASVQSGTHARPAVATLGELLGFDAIAACMPSAALATNALIELTDDGPLAFKLVSCPAAVWQFLAGAEARTVTASVGLGRLVLSPAMRGELTAAAAWLATTAGLVVIWGAQGAGKLGLARCLAGLAGVETWLAAADELPTRDALWANDRDACWRDAAVVLVSDAAPSEVMRTWLARHRAPAIWIQRDRPDWVAALPELTAVRILQAPDFTVEDRCELWRRALAERGLDGSAGDLAARFRFGPARIAQVVELASAAATDPATAVRHAAAATARPGIAALAERLPPRSRELLVLDPQLAREFDLAVAWARSHESWYRDWELIDGAAAARGVTALFAGPPGTGKTVAAQVLAGAIDRDLYRVDLSQAVSKWLGETEKNLGRLFDEAHDAGAVLFFDEADALFARRTTVRDSHDRYANLETGYLLQRLEAHRGVVLLATNRRQDLDVAFSRRFDLVLEFQPPDAAARALLWQRHLPPPHRCEDRLDVELLARRFELTGAQIRNAVLAAVARIALDEATPPPRLTLRHLVGASARELQREGRLIDAAEYGDWASWVHAAVGRVAGHGR